MFINSFESSSNITTFPCFKILLGQIVYHRYSQKEIFSLNYFIRMIEERGRHFAEKKKGHLSSAKALINVLSLLFYM